MHDGLTIYESWDLAEPIVSPRSDFYHLSPVGVSTPYVESLTGYVARLAEAHHITVEVLFSRVVMPTINKPYWICNGQKRLTSTISSKLTGINSMCMQAADWVKALQALTIREDLRFLTFLTWANVLSSWGLIRITRAWCPYCYDYWRVEGEVIYEPLLWAVKSVTICPIHQCRLRLQCNACDRPSALLEPRSRPGYCSQCRKWLGLSLEDIKPAEIEIGQEELALQSWIVAIVGELLAAAPFLSSPPPKARLAEAISSCIDRHAEGVSSRFATAIQIEKSLVWSWQKGKLKIPMDSLLRVCHYTRRSAVGLLEEESSGPSTIEPDLCSAAFHLIPVRRRAKGPLDKEKLRYVLEEALQENPPLPISKVVERLDHDRKNYYRFFPDLCHQVSARYAAYQKSTAEQKKHECHQAIRQAVLEIHQSGLYPSKQRVLERLEKPSCLSTTAGRERLREVRRELGLGRPELEV